MKTITIHPPEGTAEFLSRVEGAAALTAAGYEIKPRSLEFWPLEVFIVGRRAHYRTEDLFGEANRRIADSARPQTATAPIRKVRRKVRLEALGLGQFAQG
jgi:hypothetical protein